MKHLLTQPAPATWGRRAALALLPAALLLLPGLRRPAAPPAAATPAPGAGPYRPLVAAALPGPGARRAAPVPADTSARGLAAVWADLRRRAYFLEAETDAPARRVAANGAQRLTARLAPATYELAAALPPPARPRAGVAPVAAPAARPAWTLGLTLRGIGRGGQLALRPVAAPAVVAATDTSVRYQHGAAFAVEYTNTPAGVRQNYYLARRPAGDAGPVQVQLALATSLRATAQADGQALAFAPAGGGAPVLRYGSLRAWDATGRRLPARLHLGAGGTALALEVQDAGARYPLTIDPLASAPINRLNDPTNADNGFFGYSVAGAGDVNGDGYADVLIGAYGTANGGTARGSAYLYLGSATGLGATAGTAAGTYQRFNNPANADGDYFGHSVAGAGDVNGDGYADVLIGASGTGNGGSRRGSAYLYLGSATGLGATLGTAAGTYQRLNNPANADGDYFGYSVAGAGDVNGDGYADVLIGAYGTGNGGSRRGSAYLYLGSSAGLGATAGTAAGTYQRLNDPNNADDDNFGNSVAGAGDVNGDGYADVLIGAYGTANGGTARGSAYLYLGSATGLGATAGTAAGTYQRLNDPANADGGHFGGSVGGAGDVNGDGYADLLVGAYNTGNGGTARGSAYLYLGSATGTTAGTYQRLNDPNNANNGFFGYSVAGAGDVNGDGYADVLVGAIGTANGGAFRGSAYLYLGSATGLGTTLGTAADTVQRLDDPNNANYDYFGASVAGAGDVNGDGYADVLVGAYGTANGGSNRGSAYLYLGSPGPLRASPGLSLNDPAASDYDEFGNSVAGVGDVNADGYADVVIGAYGTTNGGFLRGSAYLYLGSATGLGVNSGTTAGTCQRLNDPTNADNDHFGYSVAGAGDINADGYADVLIGASGTANGRGSVYLFLGSAAGLGTSIGTTAGTCQRLNDPNSTDGDNFGNSVGGAGDINADGYADVVIGAFGTGNGGTFRGAVYLYYGSAAGLGTGVGSYQRLNNPNNANNDQFGAGVGGVGDVNGDGYTDVVVGVPGMANGGYDRGSIYLYYGGATGLGTGPGTTASTVQRLNSPNNTDYDQLGAYVAGAGDVNGDGYADVLLGTPNAPNGGLSRGSAYLYYGSAAGLGASVGTTAGTYQRLNDPTNADYDAFGNSVAGAGDVNGDGYADVLIGANQTANGGTKRGVTYLYLGSATGLGAALGTTAGTYQRLSNPANTNNDYFGQTVGGAGDVDGDGYADMLVCALNTPNGGSQQGAAYFYRGNLADARPGRLRLLNADLGAPFQVAANKPAGQVGLGFRSRSVLGRARARLVWEVVAQGRPFSSGTDGTVTTSVQASGRGLWTDLGTTGTELTALASKVGRTNRVRARLEYASARLAGGSPVAGTGGVGGGPRFGPWQYVPAQQLSQLTATPLPVRAVTLGGARLALYPNPAPGGAATLLGATPGAAVRVLDALGRVAATATADATGTAHLPRLAPGLYLVQAGGAAPVRLAVE